MGGYKSAMKNNDITIEEAQKHIISAILTYGSGDDNVRKCIEQMEKADFDNPVYGAVFETAKRLHNSFKPADMVTIAVEMGDGALPALADCEGLCITTANLCYYMRLIREHRKKTSVARRIKEAFESDNYIDELIKITEDARKGDGAEDYGRQTADAVLNAVRDMCSPLDESKRIATGFLKLDKVSGKLEKGTVSIIGAYPSCGKTAFALNIINYNLRHTKNKCVLFSLEMSAAQIFERMVSDRCDIDYSSIRQHTLSEEERKKAGMLSANVAKTGRLIICDRIYYAEEIVKTIGDIKPDFAVIDFLHCVRAVKKCENRRTEIDYISQCFKQCAKRYGCHIIVLCQVSRPEKGTKRPPRMSDLKESGGLEQDGDYIIMLDRPYVLDKEADPAEASVLVDKNKYGDTGQIMYKFFGHKQRFVERIGE